MTEDNQNIASSCVPPTDPWTVRFWRFFFPLVKDAPTEDLHKLFHNGMTTQFVIKMSIADRIRVLCGATVYCKVVTGMQTDPGRVASVTTTQVLHRHDPVIPFKKKQTP